MKRITLLLMIGLGWSAALAQQDSITLEDLRTPPSPVFQLLGGEPMSMCRPQTPKALSTTLLNGISAGNFAPDIALEAAPFWLKSHPNLTFDEYFGIDDHQRTGMQKLAWDWKRTSSISVATRQDDQLGTKMGVGYRFQLLGGNVDEDMQRIATAVVEARKEADQLVFLKSLEQSLPDWHAEHPFSNNGNQSMAEYIQLLVADEIALDSSKQQSYTALEVRLVAALASTTINSLEEAQQFVDQCAATIEAEVWPKVEANLNKLRQFDQNQRGGLLEFASSVLLDFPTNRWQTSYFSKAAAWLTYTYRNPHKKKREWSFMSRYLGHFKDSTIHSLDVGFRYAYTLKSASISAEGIWRESFTSDNPLALSNQPNYRLAIIGEYALNQSVGVSCTIGRDFDKPWEADLPTAGNILAVLGLQLGLAKQQGLQLQ